MTTSSKTNKNIMVAHGDVTHPGKDWQECDTCLKINIEYLQAIKRAGGLTKLVDKLARKLKLL